MGFKVPKKKKKINQASTRSSQRKKPSSSPNIFRSLISASDSQGLKLPQMKSLYPILNYLSIKTPMCFSENEDSVNGLDMEFGRERFKVIHADLLMITDILFVELDKKFECYFSALLGDSVGFDTSADMEDLTLLLRCCMVILTLSSDQTVLMKNCRFLLSALSKIFSLCVNEGNEMNSTSLKKEPASLYLCTLLEVFADELLTHTSLRKYLLLVDSISFSSEMLFACHYGPSDIGSVLEVMCCHFILSVPAEQAFEDFLKQLFWNDGRGSKVPELSLSAALSLLLHPIVLSLPKMFQANLVLLVSESINSGMSSETLRPDPSLMGLYLTAFENSVILYSRHMPGLRIGDPLSDAKSSKFSQSSHPRFECYVKEDTSDKIHRTVTKLYDLFDSGLCRKFVTSKSELVATSTAYMEENQHVLDELCKDKIFSIVACILRRASDDDDADNTEVCGKLDISPQETCLVAAILKLMSGSLLQAVLCLRCSRSTSGPQALKDSLRKGYDFIMEIICCFREFKACLPIQKFLRDLMKGQRMKHEEFEWILVHFSGLLSLSLVRGLDFLVKNCIFLIMTLLNLLSLVEDDLAVLAQLLHCESESCLRNGSPARVHEARSNSKATLKVVSNFLRIQKQQSSRDRDTMDKHEQTERACNGERFLKCVMDSTCRSLDFDDLADFVECKEEKDYHGWLQVRQKYRTWKERKMVGCRRKKMKNMWKLFKGK